MAEGAKLGLPTIPYFQFSLLATLGRTSVRPS